MKNPAKHLVQRETLHELTELTNSEARCRKSDQPDNALCYFQSCWLLLIDDKPAKKLPSMTVVKFFFFDLNPNRREIRCLSLDIETPSEPCQTVEHGLSSGARSVRP